MTDEDFLRALKEYIEGAACSLESEFGNGKSLEDLIADDEMPNVYSEVVSRLAAIKHQP